MQIIKNSNVLGFLTQHKTSIRWLLLHLEGENMCVCWKAALGQLWPKYLALFLNWKIHSVFQLICYFCCGGNFLVPEANCIPISVSHYLLSNVAQKCSLWLSFFIWSLSPFVLFQKPIPHPNPQKPQNWGKLRQKAKHDKPWCLLPIYSTHLDSLPCFNGDLSDCM